MIILLQLSHVDSAWETIILLVLEVFNQKKK